MNFTNTNSSKIRVLYLWTERGALLHAKSINTDKAWEVYEFLVDNYFRVRNMMMSYNDKAIIERLDRLEQKIDALEKNSDTIIKDIKKMVVDTTNHVLILCVSFIYDKFVK
ncbi:MAG: hypothetical protein NC177_09715 [Ruminococcus flavefaciens]|nr:hypothetical protein [Ruminococcus flavefaciens]